MRALRQMTCPIALASCAGHGRHGCDLLMARLAPSLLLSPLCWWPHAAAARHRWLLAGRKVQQGRRAPCQRLPTPAACAPTACRVSPTQAPTARSRRPTRWHSGSAALSSRRPRQPAQRLYPANGGSLGASLRQCEETGNCPQAMVQQQVVIAMRKIQPVHALARGAGLARSNGRFRGAPWLQPGLCSRHRLECAVHPKQDLPVRARDARRRRGSSDLPRRARLSSGMRVGGGS